MIGTPGGFLMLAGKGGMGWYTNPAGLGTSGSRYNSSFFVSGAPLEAVGPLDLALGADMARALGAGAAAEAPPPAPDGGAAELGFPSWGGGSDTDGFDVAAERVQKTAGRSGAA